MSGDMRAVHIHTHLPPIGKMHHLLFIPFSFLIFLFIPSSLYFVYSFSSDLLYPQISCMSIKMDHLAADQTAVWLPGQSNIHARIPASPCPQQRGSCGYHQQHPDGPRSSPWSHQYSARTELCCKMRGQNMIGKCSKNVKARLLLFS